LIPSVWCLSMKWECRQISLDSAAGLQVASGLIEAVPGGKWQTSTLVQAIALDGIRAAMLLDGPINAPSFAGFAIGF